MARKKKIDAKKADYEYVKTCIAIEGLHYCFAHYSNFEGVGDDEFHRLRLAYVNAAKELEDYVNQKAEDDE